MEGGTDSVCDIASSTRVKKIVYPLEIYLCD